MLRLGEKLKEERINKGLSLDDVSRSIKIKPSFLSAIEDSEYQKLPSVSYAQGFVKNYARFLGFKDVEIMPLFRREFDTEKNYRVLPRGFEHQQELNIKRFKIKSSFIWIIVLIILFLGFVVFQYRNAFLPPVLSIDTPKDYSTISSSEVLVSGKTDSESTVYVNSDAVSVDINGNFKKSLNVFPGKTTITVRSINKFNKETDKKIEIDVKANY